MHAHIAGRNVVVTVAGEDSDAVRKAARKVACAEAHTALVGKLLKVAETRDGHTYTWGPVTARSGAARPAPVATARRTGTARPAPVDNPTELLTLALAGDAVSRERLVALLGGAAPVAAPAAPRETFAPVAAAAARKAAAGCKTCMDHGVVRKTARDNGSVHYRTAKGADASTAIGNSTPCEARGCKAGKAARKASKAA